ncbi:MAG: OsmC family protein [Candidatus Bathyarchaeota archaeon]|jgi:putative redox protein|nr:OsmC family protein [Candidatus Bathyarchaeota archaeon A05DMB-5]MDH7557694.1 OsmC family protein [Candidatus Bathyarchaeota archaeon]
MLTKLFANAKLVKDYRIDVDDGRNHAVCLDLPRDTGTDMGPSALELCVMSHAGCYATIFVLTAKKMRISLKDLEVKVEAVKSEEVGTITEAKFEITAKGVPKNRMQRMHEVTLQNCPVGKLFEKAGVKLSYKVKAIEE